jgi:hypothetical protein
MQRKRENLWYEEIDREREGWGEGKDIGSRGWWWRRIRQ